MAAKSTRRCETGGPVPRKSSERTEGAYAALLENGSKFAPLEVDRLEAPTREQTPKALRASSLFGGIPEQGQEPEKEGIRCAYRGLSHFWQ